MTTLWNHFSSSWRRKANSHINRALQVIIITEAAITGCVQYTGIWRVIGSSTVKSILSDWYDLAFSSVKSKQSFSVYITPILQLYTTVDFNYNSFQWNINIILYANIHDIARVFNSAKWGDYKVIDIGTNTCFDIEQNKRLHHFIHIRHHLHRILQILFHLLIRKQKIARNRSYTILQWVYCIPSKKWLQCYVKYNWFTKYQQYKMNWLCSCSPDCCSLDISIWINRNSNTDKTIK